MKIDKPYNYGEFFRSSMFANSPRILTITNGFYPGIPTDFLQYKNHMPTNRKPEVLV